MGTFTKRAALAVIDQPLVGRLLARLRPDRTAILMLHRFAEPDGSRRGHDPARLRALLAYLRSCGVALLDLDEAIQATLEHTGSPRPPAVVITVDDCYPDALDVGLPIFREFDCPATGFIVPHMIERTDWFWWDQIAWILRWTSRHALTVELAGTPVSLAWTDAAGRDRIGHDLVERIKRVSTHDRIATIAQLATVADVPLPETPPAEFQVAHWDALRTAERAGMRFGAHTLSHPVLSQCTDPESAQEITGSIVRVQAELGNPSRVFCYPVGRAQDFGPREMAAVEQAGMLAAVSAVPGMVHPGITHDLGADWRWQVPRYGYDERRGVTARLLFL